jgi:hypothetical protein
VPRGEERVHQADRDRQERERLEVHGRSEAVAVRDAAQGQEGGRRQGDLEDRGAAFRVAVLADHGARARDEEQDRAKYPDWQRQPIATELLEQDAAHQAAGSVSMLSP